MKKDNSTEATILRKRAEELLKKKPLKTGSLLSEVEAIKLVHELEVHQVELELQNEELLLANKIAAELAAEKYAELYDFAPSGYFTLSQSDTIIDLNLSGAEMLGEERSHLKNSRFGPFVSNDTKPIFKHFLGEVFRSKAKLTCEITLTRNHNKPIYILLSGIASKNAEQCFVTAVDITEHKLAEELIVSEARYRRLFESAKDGILILDAETGMIKDVNPFLIEMLGYSEEQFIEKEIWEIGFFKDIAANKDKFLELQQKEYVRYDDLPLETADGRKINVEFVSNVYLVDHHKVIQCNIRDITKRKRAEEKLLHVSRLYALLSQINEAIVRIREQDELFRIICQVAIEYGQFRMAWIGLADETNNRIKPVAHAGHEDGYLDQILISTEDVPTGRGPTGSAFREGKIMTSSDIATEPRKVPWRDEALKRGYRSSAAVPFSRKGRLIGTFTLYATDPGFFTEEERKLLQEIGGGISFALDAMASETERRRAEEALHKSETGLKEAQRIGRLGSWDWDAVTDTITWSEEYYNIYGFDPKQSPLGYVEHLKAYTPESAARLDAAVEMNLQTGEPYKLDLELACPAGPSRWITARSETKRDKNGHIVGLCGTAQDITESKRAEEELIIAKEKAEESDRLKSAFLANMSHEIRTPMNGILGFAELLKVPELDGEKQQYYISIIEKSGVRMLSIINDIVSISKVDSGQMKVSVSETNINEQVEYIYTFFKPEVEQKGMQISYRNALPAREAIINTDREKIYAILTNLVKNAIKYTDEGSIEFGYGVVEMHGRASLHIPASLQHASYLQFYVKDTGIGIPKNRQQAIFDRFVQSDVPDKMARQGAGLGLSISKAYVEMLGGKIWVESEVGIGSTFYFTIPCHTQAEEKIVSNDIVLADVEEDRMNRLKILIAEDDEESEMLLSMAVNKYSEKVLTAKTGIEAVEVCHNNPDLDLVLMDIKMPEMDGYEATRRIRKFNKNLVIVAQTAFALSGDREKAIAAGCTDYISKPIRKDKLIEVMHRYFQ